MRGAAPRAAKACGDGRKLDRFRAGPDDEVDTRVLTAFPLASAVGEHGARTGAKASWRCGECRYRDAGHDGPRMRAAFRGDRLRLSMTAVGDAMLIAQITDLHIGFDRDNPHELNVRRLNMVIDQFNELQPQAGPADRHRRPGRAWRRRAAPIATWKRWSERWQGPLLWAVGNHDGRANFLEVLPEVPTDANGFIQYEADHGGLRLIVVDTLDPGRHGGMVCEQRATWLRGAAGREDRRADGDRPAPSAGRHRDRLDERAAVRRMGAAARRGDPPRQAGGRHARRPRPPPDRDRASPASRLVVAASTAPLVALDLEDVDPLHPDGRALIIGDAPAFAIHYWDGATLLSHFEIAGPRNVIASYNSNLQPMMKAFLEERGTG